MEKTLPNDFEKDIDIEEDDLKTDISFEQKEKKESAYFVLYEEKR